MQRRLIGAALALVIAGGPGLAAGKQPTGPPPHGGAGVTTLEPAGGGGWRVSGEADDTFTPVGVIGGRSLNVDADPNGALSDISPAISPEVAPANVAAEAAKPTATHATGWLPEPATWILLLLGLAMIGFALRGLLAARRRLSRLEESEPEA